jgi:hypothetical protein
MARTNPELLAFFDQHYAPGRVGLVGTTDAVGTLIREAEAPLTPGRGPSRWSHCFVLGERRNDRRGDGGIYVFESDLKVSVEDWQVQNGAMESRLAKWCRDDVEHAAVLGMDFSPEEAGQIVAKGLEFAYEYENLHLRYAVGELFGTLWAILTRKLNRRNVFDERYAVQCATFVRMCYQAVGRDPIEGPTDLSHTSPEALWQSQGFALREHWRW